MNRISKKIITEYIDNAIHNMDLKSHHISNDEIRVKVGRMTLEEKKSLLDDKMNPFEKRNYDDLYKDLEVWESVVEDEKSNGVENPYSAKELKKAIEGIFNYEKRIIRGYDLDKHKDKVPSYDLNDFNEEKYGDDGDVNIGSLEQSQLDYQEKHMYIDGEHILEDKEVSSLKDYFGRKSGQINSQLSKKYKNGLWGEIPSDMQKEWKEDNKNIIPNIDSAMKKSPNLEVNTVLYHGVQDSQIVDIHSRVGDKVNLTSFISTSYSERVGKSYGENIGGKTLYVKFLAPKNTRGLCANDKHLTLTGYPTEHEYLLDRNQKGSIVDINYDTGIVTILLDT